MSEQNTPTMQEILAEMTAMRAELASLKARNQALPHPTVQPKPEVSTTRRRLLRKLAGGLVAGLAVGGIGVSLPQAAEAKISSNPTTNGQSGRVGMLVVPPNATVSGSLDSTHGLTKVGLVVGGDSSFNIAAFTPTVNAAILAYTSNNGSAIVGQTQTGTGVYGQSDNSIGVSGKSTTGAGMYGQSDSGTGVHGYSKTGPGISGESDSSIGINGSSNTGIGVYGNVPGANGKGVSGSAFGSNGLGVYGSYGDVGNTHPIITGNTGVYGIGTIGVCGVSTSTGGTAVYAESSNFGVFTTSTYIGIYSKGDIEAGYFIGDVYVSGTINKSAVRFKLDHPLDPANKYLYHTCVESPDMMNIYNGLATLDGQGEATVEMPDWFEALNSDFRYQLTALDSASPNLHIASRLKERKFTIAGGLPGQEVSWQITGIRQDAYAKAHRLPVEQDKSEDEKGKYLHPEPFGQPEEMSLHPRPVRPEDASK